MKIPQSRHGAGIARYLFRTLFHEMTGLYLRQIVISDGACAWRGGPELHQGKSKAVVDLTRSITKLDLQSCTLGCLSRVSIMKRE